MAEPCERGPHREDSFYGMRRARLGTERVSYSCPDCETTVDLPRCEITTRAGMRCANPSRARVCRYHASLGAQVGKAGR